jgi:hypothetical protein
LYEVFDQFVKIPSWHTGHPLDRARFMRALAKVIRQKKFDPEGMGTYLRANCSEDIWGPSDRFEKVIAALVGDAAAIREYMTRPKDV